jgi:hypothetical protein
VCARGLNDFIAQMQRNDNIQTQILCERRKVSSISSSNPVPISLDFNHTLAIIIIFRVIDIRKPMANQVSTNYFSSQDYLVSLISSRIFVTSNSIPRKIKKIISPDRTSLFTFLVRDCYSSNFVINRYANLDMKKYLR